MTSNFHRLQRKRGINIAIVFYARGKPEDIAMYGFEDYWALLKRIVYSVSDEYT